MPNTPIIPTLWAQKLLNEFYDNILLSSITKGISAQEVWDSFKSDLGMTDMKLHEAEHIPDHVKKMIDKVTEAEGQCAGLNFIYGRHWETFKSIMLLSGAHVTEAKEITVPSPRQNEWVCIGMKQAINVGDLNIFFGILNGTYIHPSKHGNHLKVGP